MKIKKIIGYSILCTPFITLFVLMAIKSGIIAALTVFGFGAFIIGAIFLGVYLTND